MSSADSLAARTRELDRIQTLGRRAAEAQTLDELFEIAATLLAQVGSVDVVLIAHRLEAIPRCTAFMVRPLSEVVQRDLEQRANQLLQVESNSGMTQQWRPIDGYEAEQTPRATLVEADLLVQPLVRAGVPLGYLVAVLVPGSDESGWRLTSSVANQLSVHIERILDVQDAEHDRFRSILESMSQAVLWIDHRFEIVQVNQAAESWAAAMGVEPRGSARPIAELLGFQDQIEAVLERGEPANAEVSVRGDRVFHVNATALSRPSASARGAVIVITERTEAHRLQRQLAQSEKMSSLGQMISGVAHELNNPLSTILGYTQLLGSMPGDGKLTRRMSVLHEEAQRCQRIVRNLLSFARQREPERKAVSLNETVQSVVSLLRYQMKVANVELQVELDAELPAIEGDAHQLQQVLVNLLTNAKHAIEQSADSGRVTVQTSQVDGAVELAVTDSGGGVPAEIRSKIFDPFFTTKPEGQGTGLGLALVYGIVSAHAGRITLDDDNGGGTTFRVRLPAATPQAQRRDEPRETTAPAVGSARILIVDDERPFAQMICEALAEDGHLTQAVYDGKQALEQLARSSYDLVISDIRMPGMDGSRLRQEIQQRQPALAERLLMTTGDTLGGKSLAAPLPARADVLHKPFSLDQLRRRVTAKLSEQ